MNYLILTIEYPLIPISCSLKMSLQLVKLKTKLEGWGELQRLNTQLLALVKLTNI